MFFLIGGVQPKKATLDPIPRVCPSCGLARAKLKRVDHYVSLFFIPVFPIKRGIQVLICDSCGAVSSTGQVVRGREPDGERGCARCGYPVSSEFRYCPGCGARI
ncbi:MAG: zinc ribbon domain-containing protein [Syntrophobacteraceae bacterium]